MMAPRNRPIHNLTSRLSKVRRNGRNRDGDGYIACCPAHDDQHPSLGITEKPDGALLVNCLAGCRTEDVLAAVGLTKADLYPAHRRKKPSQSQGKGRSSQQSPMDLRLDFTLMMVCANDMAKGRTLAESDRQKFLAAAHRVQYAIGATERSSGSFHDL